MNVYQAFFGLKSGTHDLDFVADLERMMTHMKNNGKIEGWRLLRSKLGLTPSELGEFQLLIEVKDLAQLDDAFKLAATRSGDVEVMHFDVNSKVQDIKFALYRDFPDPVRQHGEELF